MLLKVARSVLNLSFLFTEGGEMVDSSTQTPRDEDSAKPEEGVTIEDEETTGAAPNMEQDDKQGSLELLYYLQLYLSE